MANNRPAGVRISGTTEVEVETFEFLWTLKNISLLFDAHTRVKSSNFRGGTESNHLWHLEIRIPEKKVVNSVCSVYLFSDDFGECDNSEGRTIKVKSEISLLKACGKPGLGPISKVNEFEKTGDYGWDIMKASELFSASRQLVVNDTLKLLCSITIFGNVKHEIGNISFGLMEKRSAREHQVCSDFGKLFQDSVLTDFTVMTNSTSFPAHKVVLAARSSVFSAMFHTNMAEAAMNSVKIVDFDDDVVKAMLEYIYTGQTEKFAELAVDLFKIADKYDVPGLKEDCEFFIAGNLTVENATHVLVMAHTYNANLLKSRVVDYINRNKEGVKQTISFQEALKTHGGLLCSLLF